MLSWSIVLLFIYISSFSEAALVLVPEYPVFNVAVGDGATVKCTNLNLAGDQPEWRDPDGRTIGVYGGGGSNELYVSYETNADAQKLSKLQFSSVTKARDGSYGCHANGDAETIYISIYQPVEFPNADTQTEQFLEYHQVGIILCTMDAEVGTEVDWLGPNGPIITGGRYFIDPYYSMTINNVTLEDEGQYDCKGTVPNVGSSRTLQIFADVQVPPKIRYPPIDKNNTEGTSAFFTCEAIGDPQPEYIWKDSSLVLESGSKYNITQEGRRLAIYNLVEADEKSYTCEVRNRAGEDQRDGFLTVDIPPTPTRPVTQAVNEGGSIKLFCDIQRGDVEQLVLQWKRYEKWLPLGVQVDSRIVIEVESGDGTIPGNPGSLSLSISNIHRGDEGPYTCFARNNGGYATADSILNVRYAPIINLEYTPSKMYSWVGHDVNLTCHWYGFPVPTVRWFINSRPLVGTVGDVAGNATIYDFNNGTSTLFIKTTEDDFLPYQCEGKNNFGTNTHHIQFRQAYPMKKPTNLQAYITTSTTIELTFDDPIEIGADYPEYLKITGYVVGYNELSDSTLIEEQYQVFEDECSPNEFLCGRLCIEKERRCDNFIDCVDNSDETNCDSDETCSGGFKCPVRDGSQNPCLPLNYACDQFPDCVDGADETEESCNLYFKPKISDIRLVNLRPDRNYRFRLAVLNEVGWGEWSYDSSDKTLDYGPPGAPEVFERQPDRETSYELVWVEPYDDGGSPIISYEIAYSAVQNPDVKELGVDVDKIPAPSSSETAPVHRRTITNLKQGTYYYLELVAESTWGESSPAPLSFQTKGGALVPPVTDKPEGPSLRIGELSLPAFIGILVGGFLLILLLLDLTCFCTNNCGLTMCICIHLCGKTSEEEKEEREAVEYGMSISGSSRAGERMRMQRLAEVELDSNGMDGTTNYPLSDLAVVSQPGPPIYGDLVDPLATTQLPGYRGYGYPAYNPSEAHYSGTLDDRSFKKDRLQLEQDLNSIFS